MKKFYQKTAVEFDINNQNDMRLLQKQANFTYTDQYLGKEGKRLNNVFKQSKFKQFLEKYRNPPLKVAQIAILGNHGFGVLATEDIKLSKGRKEKKLGIYWGELSHESSHLSPYIFTLSHREIDAKKYGNWTRFVNHSKGNFNVIANQKTAMISNKRLPYIEYALVKNVKAGEQLLIDYGPEYEFDKKHQIFLNPSNNSLKSSEIFKLYDYVPIKGALLNVCRELIPNARKLYGPKNFVSMLNRLTKKNHDVSCELPILAANKHGKILPDKYQQGVTILMLAAYMGKIKVVKNLLKKYHANVDQQNTHNGYTALFYAINSQSSQAIKDKIVKQLIDADIHLMTQDKEDGYTILHWCAKQKNLHLLKLFFTHKKSEEHALDALNILARDDFCPMMLAISMGEIKIASYLLDIYAKNYKETIFHSRHNDWLLPTMKKIIRDYSKKNLPAMLDMLLSKGLAKNRKLHDLIKKII